MTDFEKSVAACRDAGMTFEGATKLCITVLEAKASAEAKAFARGELLRYARELDRMAANCGGAFLPDDTPLEGD